ncbi:MAG: 8-amino-7-oxononanoate synthase [Veillonellales bacterium]
MKFLTEYLEEAKSRNLYRQTTVYEPLDPVHVRQNGRTYLILAANNYLGLTHCPAVRQAASAAAMSYGTGSGGARLITGTYPLYAQLEQRIAAFKGTEAALVFNTGYMANVGTMSALAGPEDVIFSDELNHASIIDGCRLSRARIIVYRHANTDHLAACLKSTPCHGKRLIVTDGVFSMDGDIAPLPDIVQLARRYDAIVAVDDAHATGVIGPGGRGTAAYYHLADQVPVQIGTLSKALGAEGGFVAGSHELIDYLLNRARSFIFSTALAPATVAAAAEALNQLVRRPELVVKLRDNAEFVRSALTVAGLKIGAGQTPIIPVTVGAAEAALQLSEDLKSEGLILSAIRPPTVPAGSSRLRLALSAAHNQTELGQASEKIAAAVKRLAKKKRVKI